jgi:hypothetical protein
VAEAKNIHGAAWLIVVTVNPCKRSPEMERRRNSTYRGFIPGGDLLGVASAMSFATFTENPAVTEIAQRG